MNRFLQPRISACLALLIYGSWAGYSNLSHGLSMALRAFSVQGVCAFALTLGLGYLVLGLYDRLAGYRHAAKISVLCGLLVQASVPVSLHGLAGTAEIMRSVLPGQIIGSIYLLLIVRRARHQAQGNAAADAPA